MLGNWSLRLLGATGFGAIGWRLGGVVSQASTIKEEFFPWGLALSLSGLPIGALVMPYLTTVPPEQGDRQVQSSTHHYVDVRHHRSIHRLGICLALVSAPLLTGRLARLGGPR